MQMNHEYQGNRSYWITKPKAGAGTFGLNAASLFSLCLPKTLFNFHMNCSVILLTTSALYRLASVEYIFQLLLFRKIHMKAFETEFS
jgi:hypothetical protein